MPSVDDLVLRPVTDDEFPAFARAVERAFGADASDRDIERWRKVTELDRTLAAFHGDRIVGNTALWSLSMSLPGADPVPCAGVTAVGVAHDVRRRGVLTRLMRRQLDDVRERGEEPFAALYASESPIYGRFGYGLAAPHLRFEIERPWTALREPTAVADVELVDADTAIARFPAIHAAAGRGRGGFMQRPEGWWRHWLAHDLPEDRDGMSPRFHAVIGDRGYVVYRVKDRWEAGVPAGELLVIELAAADPGAAAALWAFVFGVDLVHTVKAPMRPVDDPLPFLLVNRARLRDPGGEDLWLRLVDVGAALAARGYAVDDRLVLEVRDAFCDWNRGRWELETADGGGRCERTDADPDLALDVADLAAISLGGVSPVRLAWAGRIEERTPGALGRARALFASDLAPWNSFEF